MANGIVKKIMNISAMEFMVATALILILMFSFIPGFPTLVADTFSVGENVGTFAVSNPDTKDYAAPYNGVYFGHMTYYVLACELTGKETALTYPDQVKGYAGADQPIQGTTYSETSIASIGEPWAKGVVGYWNQKGNVVYNFNEYYEDTTSKNIPMRTMSIVKLPLNAPRITNIATDCPLSSPTKSSWFGAEGEGIQTDLVEISVNGKSYFVAGTKTVSEMPNIPITMNDNLIIKGACLKIVDNGIFKDPEFEYSTPTKVSITFGGGIPVIRWSSPATSGRPLVIANSDFCVSQSLVDYIGNMQTSGDDRQRTAATNTITNSPTGVTTKEVSKDGSITGESTFEATDAINKDAIISVPLNDYKLIPYAFDISSRPAYTWVDSTGNKFPAMCDPVKKMVWGYKIGTTISGDKIAFEAPKDILYVGPSNSDAMVKLTSTELTNFACTPSDCQQGFDTNKFICTAEPTKGTCTTDANCGGNEFTLRTKGDTIAAYKIDFKCDNPTGKEFGGTCAITYTEIECYPGESKITGEICIEDLSNPGHYKWALRGEGLANCPAMACCTKDNKLNKMPAECAVGLQCCASTAGVGTCKTSCNIVGSSSLGTASDWISNLFGSSKVNSILITLIIIIVLIGIIIALVRLGKKGGGLGKSFIKRGDGSISGPVNKTVELISDSGKHTLEPYSSRLRRR